jgi:protein TonB
MSGSSIGGGAATVETGVKTPQYQLSDDLARLCLPAEFKDDYRNLAWVNSICFLFLVIGLVGIKPMKIVERPLSEIVEPVAVELPAPQEQPQAQPEAQPEETPQETPTETPQVAAVVAAADPSSVAFSVPVVGAVAVKEARFATPPPPVNYTPPKLTRFDPNTAKGGSFPAPDYPGIALRNQWQGTPTVEIHVDPSGAITSVVLKRSSGFPALDQAALNIVKNSWKFPPGQERYLSWDCIFKMQ